MWNGRDLAGQGGGAFVRGSCGGGGSWIWGALFVGGGAGIVVTLGVVGVALGVFRILGFLCGGGGVLMEVLESLLGGGGRPFGGL